MTEQEYLALPPEEQAGVVAERAMGYTWWIAPSGCRYLVAPENERHVAQYARKADGTEPICRDYLRDVPHLPTDIVAAWHLKDVLYARFCGAIQITKRSYNLYEVSVGGIPDGSGAWKRVAAMAATFQLAICLAALKAVGFIT